MKKRIVVVAALVALALTECTSLDAGAHDPAFFDLVRTGKPQDVQAAISKGADVNDRSNSGWTPLMAAAMFNPQPEVMTIRLKAGAEVNARDNRNATPLMYAADSNPNPAVIATLLAAGADINARDKAGWTPLMYAVSNLADSMSNPPGSMIILLLNAGADAKPRDSLGRSALDMASGDDELKDTAALQQLEQASQ